MTPTESQRGADELGAVRADERLSEQLRAIQRALDERRDAESSGPPDEGWLWDARARS
jgi:type II secretory pathway pseudopilin PulG